MAADEESVLFAFEADGSGADAVLADIDDGLASLSESIASVAESVDELSSLDDAFAGLAEAISANTEMLGSLMETLTELSGNVDELVFSLQMIDESGPVFEALAADAEEAAAALADAGAAGTEAGAEIAAGAEEAAAATDDLKTAQKPLKDDPKGGFGNAQMGAMLLVGAIGSLGKSFFDMGSQAEDSFATVEGMAGVSKEQIAQMMPALQQDAVTFGDSMQEVGNALYFVESAGYKGQGALEVEREALEASSASGADFSQVASALTSELHAYGVGAEQAKGYTDDMIEGVVQGKQSFQDFSSVIGPLANIGHQTGLSFQEVVSAEATLTQINPHVRQDGTELQTMFKALGLNIDATAATAKKLGLNFDENSYKSKDLLGKLQYLQEISKGNQSDFEKLVGGSSGLSAALAILSEKGSTYAGVLGKMQSDSGATDQAFQKASDTISHHAAQVGAAASVIAQDIVGMAAPYVNAALSGLASAFGSLATFITQHAQIAIPIIVTLAAVIGGVLVAALVALVGPMLAAVGTILAAAAPFIALGAVIAGVAAIIVANWNKVSSAIMSSPIGDAVRAVTSTVSSIFDAFGRHAQETTIQTKLSTVNTTISQKQALIQQYEEQRQQLELKMEETHSAVAQQAIQTKIDAINHAEEQTKGVIAAAQKEKAGVERQLASVDPVVALHSLKQKNIQVSSALATSQEVVAKLNAQKAGIEHALMGSVDATKRAALEQQLAAINASLKQKEGVVKNLDAQKTAVEKSMAQQQAIVKKDSQGNALISMWQNILATIGKVGAFLQSDVLPIFKSIGSFIVSQFLPIWQQLQQLWSGQLMPLFKQLWAAITPLLPVFELLAKVAGGILVVALGLLVGMFSAVIKGVAGLWSGIITVFGGIVQVVTGVVQVISGIVTFIYDLFTGQFGKLGGDLGRIWQGITNIFLGGVKIIVGIFQGLWGLVSGAISGFVQGVIGFFTHLWDELVGHSIVPDMINGIVNFFTGLPGKLLGIIEGMVTGILGKFGSMASGALNFVGKMWDSITGKTDQAAAQLAIKHQEMALISEQKTQEMAVKNVANLDKERQGILAQLSTCTNGVERQHLLMKLKSVEQMEEQQKAVAQKAAEEKQQTLKHIEELKEQAIEAHKNLAEKCWDAISGFVGNVLNKIGQLKDQFIQHILDLKNQAVSHMEELRSQIIQKVQDLVHNFIGELQSLPGQAAQIIENMITGMTNAIANGVGQLVKGAQNMASSVANTISSYLHFSVPEQGPLHDAPNWMHDMIALMAEGVEQNTDKLRSAAQGLGSALSTSLTGALPGTEFEAPGLATAQAMVAQQAQGTALGGPGGQNQVVSLLTQMLGALQRQQNGGLGGSLTTISMNNSINAPGVGNAQQLYNLLLSLAGYQYQSLQRGSFGI